jgi:hypothetical protein
MPVVKAVVKGYNRRKKCILAVSVVLAYNETPVSSLPHNKLTDESGLHELEIEPLQAGVAAAKQNNLKYFNSYHCTVLKLTKVRRAIVDQLQMPGAH